MDWGRFTQAALSQVGKMLGFSAHSSGGSTLATQIEKYRHSAEGRTGSIGDKLRQMLSASVRSYREGPANFAARQDIVLTYLNSVPLSARRATARSPAWPMACGSGTAPTTGRSARHSTARPDSPPRAWPCARCWR